MTVSPVIIDPAGPAQPPLAPWSPSKRRRPWRILGRTALSMALLPLLFLILVCSVTAALEWQAQKPVMALPGGATAVRAPDGSPSSTLDKQKVQHLLAGQTLTNLSQKRFDLVAGNRRLRVETSLDIRLQQLLLDSLEPENARSIGIVAVEPETGRVLAMVGYDRQNPALNPCIESRFPAASIFKIVTASAAVEQHHLVPDSKLYFTGNRYTLYRSQLSERKVRHARTITLRDSFAQSVNPVFGKIGANQLGREVLEDYAERFGFNRRLGFEAALNPSHIRVPVDRFEMAEIASGYNRSTTISPLHGALLAAAVLNRGVIFEPTIVDRILDESGRAVYRGQQRPVNQAIAAGTSRVLGTLMAATVTSGTCRKAFKGFQQDRILSQLNIGAKSGSINNDAQDTRFDWFVGFAEEKGGGEKLAIAAVVAHGDLVGTRAAEYARLAIREYFREYFAASRHTSARADG